MFSQLFVQIFALYKFFRKNLGKKRRKFSMDPIWSHIKKVKWYSLDSIFPKWLHRQPYLSLDLTS